MIDIPANERICQFCEHCFIQMPTSDYSEVTAGCDFSMQCEKKHWTLTNNAMDQPPVLFVACITAARTCPDWSLNAKIVEEVERRALPIEDLSCQSAR